MCSPAGTSSTSISRCLQRIAARLNHPLLLGREPGAMRLRKAEGYFGSGQASIPGRVVLDGIDLLRGAFVRMDDYSLDAVAREVLGEGKAVAGDVQIASGKSSTITGTISPAFALYARTDARLAFAIVEKLNLVRARLCAQPADGHDTRSRRGEHRVLRLSVPDGTRAARVVAPSVRGGRSRVYARSRAATCWSPSPAYIAMSGCSTSRACIPSIIRTFNIDPLAYVRGSRRRRGSHPHGRRRIPPRPAILPRMLDELFPRREAAKKAGDARGVARNQDPDEFVLRRARHAGVPLPQPGARQCDHRHGPRAAAVVEGVVRGGGSRCCTATPTACSCVRPPTIRQARRARGARARGRAERATRRHIADQWRVPSRLELEFEKLYLRLFLPRARHGTRGARKRYAGLVSRRRTPDNVEFVGMEVVRRDWTALAKHVQRELYQRLFTDQPVDEYLAEVVAQVRTVRSTTSSCTARICARTPVNTPPPRRRTSPLRASPPAARPIDRYSMTTAGPEPLDNVRHPLDREHYVEKQIRPVAEPVLATLGLEFERVIGDSRQLELY